jgi:hypothetical protein
MPIDLKGVARKSRVRLGSPERNRRIAGDIGLGDEAIDGAGGISDAPGGADCHRILLTFPYLPQGDHRGGFALEWA